MPSDQQIIQDVIDSLERLIGDKARVVLPLTTHYHAVCLLDELKQAITPQRSNP